jgi:serine protease DegS
MKFNHSISFLLQAIMVALIAIIVILFLRPELIQPASRVVEIRESPAPLPDTTDAAHGIGTISYAPAVQRAAPAVVNIYTAKVVTQRMNPLLEDPVFRRFFGDNLSIPQKRLETSLGSGVIMSPQGYIVTNNHVIADADTIQVQLHDGRNTEAAVIGRDEETDLAVLKIDMDNLPVITLGSTELNVGDVVLAIGNPFGVGQTVTVGIVSATGRTQLGINTFENFIQTDAAINPGNSGGALINPYGQLVGINTAIFSRSGGSQGIGFAIPVALARDVMTQIVEHQRVIRGWLGVEAQELTPALATSFGLQKPEGVIVAGILRKGPADTAGLRPGDIILQIGDAKVVNPSMLLNVIAQTAPGSSINLKVLRAGKQFSLDAVVVERPRVVR